MNELLSLIIGLMVAGVAIVIGYRARARSHQLLPLRDPGWIMLMAAEFALAVLLALDWLPLPVTDFGLVAVLAFDLGYLLGYMLNKPADRINIDLPDESHRCFPQPLVRYWYCGQCYRMPQTVGSAFGALVGLRQPLTLDLSRAGNVQPCAATNGLITVELPAVIPIACDRVSRVRIGMCCIRHRKVRDADRNIIDRVPVYLFHVWIESHEMLVSDSVCDDPESFYMRKETWKEAVQHSAAAQARAARLEIQSEAAKFDSAADLVTNLIDLGADAPDAAEDLEERIRDERRRREPQPEQEVNDDSGDDQNGGRQQDPIG